MHINNRRIVSGEATPLADSDEVCFGLKVPNNELKYRFFMRGGVASLERSTESFACKSPPCHMCPPTTPTSSPAGGTRLICNGGSQSAPPAVQKSKRTIEESQPLAKKRLKLLSSGEACDPLASSFTPTRSPNQPSLLSASQPSNKTFISQSKVVLFPQMPDSSTGTPLQSISSSVKASQPVQVFIPHDSTLPKNRQSQRISSACLTAPVSPNKSADEELDELFQDIVSQADKSILDGEKAAMNSASIPTVPITNSPVDREMDDFFDGVAAISEDELLEGAAAMTPVVSTRSTEKLEGLNPTVISAAETSQETSVDTEPSTSGSLPAAALSEGAQELTQQVKDELLSSIKALKSELEAKNELISKQEQEKKNEDAGGVVSSISEEFTCVICQELFINAHTLQCSHSFCECCIKDWIKTKQQCPICRKPVGPGPVRTLALDNAIATVESKLSEEEQQEREALKEERRRAQLREASTTLPPSTSQSSSDDNFIGEALDSDSSDPESSNSGLEAVYRNILMHRESFDSGYDAVEYGGFGRCYHCGK